MVGEGSLSTYMREISWFLALSCYLRQNLISFTGEFRHFRKNVVFLGNISNFVFFVKNSLLYISNLFLKKFNFWIYFTSNNFRFCLCYFRHYWVIFGKIILMLKIFWQIFLFKGTVSPIRNAWSDIKKRLVRIFYSAIFKSIKTLFFVGLKIS